MSKDYDYQIHTLANGIRIVHKQVISSKVAHCGIMLDIGSRDENEKQFGIAHFWEHMAFKGTQKRNALQIINSLESVGGELNAYTTKEKICFHASVLVPHFEKALDVLADITFNSSFPEKEIEKERGVILEEMAMYLDDPEDAIHDEFDEVIFRNHSLGINILGTEESVKSFQRKDFYDFLKSNLNTHRIIFSSVSALPFETVVKKAEKYLSEIPQSNGNTSRIGFQNYEPQHVVNYKSISQTHSILGREAYHIHHPNRLAFIILCNILGGPGMNSKLNLSLREKYGLVYNVDASYQSYLDTGLFHIYFSTEAKKRQKSLDLIQKELDLFKDKMLTDKQLQIYKNQLMGQLAMSEENNSGFMQMMAKSILDLDKIDSLDSIFEQINAVSPAKIQEIAIEMFDMEQFSSLTYLPA